MPSGLTQSQEQLLAYSNWGTLPSGQPLRALAGTTGLVPAAVTLCIFQVSGNQQTISSGGADAKNYMIDDTSAQLLPGSMLDLA